MDGIALEIRSSITKTLPNSGNISAIWKKNKRGWDATAPSFYSNHENPRCIPRRPLVLSQIASLKKHATLEINHPAPPNDPKFATTLRQKPIYSRDLQRLTKLFALNHIVLLFRNKIVYPRNYDSIM